MNKLRVALAGNPNAGKSTIFNALTGSHQHVGNWPGKTVEKKEGKFRHGDTEIQLVDLPGTYSLTAFSPEEVIARDFIINQKPDVVVTVVDAANLERNLYLTVQVLELGVPVIVTLNMSDLADERGMRFDLVKLSEGLQSPVIPTTANRRDGIDQLVRAMSASAAGDATSDPPASGSTSQPFQVDYGREVEEEIFRLQGVIDGHPHIGRQYPPRWLAIKLLENDHDIQLRLKVLKGGAELLAAAEKSTTHLEEIFGDESDVIIADHRYGFINGLVREVVKRTHEDRLLLSDQIDRVVTSRLLGIPIFMLAMWVVFKLTADVSAPYLDWVESVIRGPISRWTVALLAALGLGDSWVESLAVNGVIAGVGGVLVFVPVLMFLYLALAVLEDSGYMARAAFVMDRLMHTLGLHGKSFLPMLVGFGCTVPAFYATRTLENEKDRILTGLLVPFMSCGARLPVYVLFAAVFFPHNAGAVVFIMYLLGILTAILLGIILKNTLFKSKEQSAFVMELPPYRLPTLRGIWFHMWERTNEFVRKAWSLILVTSIILWVLMAIPLNGGKFAESPVETSVFASASRMVTPLMAPLGLNSWEASGALITGLVAKEVVISTLSQVYAVGEVAPPAVASTFFQDVGGILLSFIRATFDTLKSLPKIIGIDLFGDQGGGESTALMGSIRDSFEATSGGHGALAGLAFMIFVLLYTPCITAMAAERHELGAKWMWISVIGQLALAWMVGMLVFQVGKLLGLG